METARSMSASVALEKDPDLRTAQNNLALSYAAGGKLNEARQELLASGNPAETAFNSGMLYMALGKYDQAEEAFRTAWDLRPNFTAALERWRQAARLAAMRAGAHDNSNSSR